MLTFSLELVDIFVRFRVIVFNNEIMVDKTFCLQNLSSRMYVLECAHFTTRMLL
jgi:hypothetical protein